jgi:Concanavalin A-like lectin/glucanases superfamily
MTLYINENFDGVTPPALPAGLSVVGTVGFIVVTSSLESYSSPNSLQFTLGGGAYSTASFNSITDTNSGNNTSECKFYAVSVAGTSQQLICCLRGVTAPSGANLPGNAFAFYGSMVSGGNWSVGYTNSSGSTVTALATTAVTGAFSAGAWYRLVPLVQDTPDSSGFVLSMSIQRMSDGAWLQPSGSWGTVGDVQVPFLVSLTTYSFILGGGTFTYNASWATGTTASFGWKLAIGEIGYLDDLIFQDVPILTGALPSNPPAAGNEVELVYNAATGSDTGTASHGGSQLNAGDASFSTYYKSASNFNQYAILDAGGSVLATPTALLWSPALGSDTIFGGLELYGVGLQLEGGNSTPGGPWALLGAPPTNMYPEPNNISTVRLNPASPGGTFRYFRLRSPNFPCCVNQFRLLVQNSGGVSWRPARPTFTPAAGHYLAGQKVVVSTTTGSSSIGYNVGTRTTPPIKPSSPSNCAVVNGSSATITLASNSPDETWVAAVAFNASGNTTISAVANGHFIVGQAAYSLQFNGTTDYAVVANSAVLQLSGACTLFCRVFLPAKATSFTPVIDKESGSGSNSSYYLGFNQNTTNGQIYFGFNAGANEIDYAIPSAGFYGAWHDVMGVFTGSGLILYVDGVSVLTGGNSTSQNVNTSQVTIGAYTPLGNFFNGSVRDVALFSTALSSTVAANFAAGTDVPINHSPVALWYLDGTLADYSGNNNNLTSHGTPPWANNSPGNDSTLFTPTSGDFVPDTLVTGNTWYGNGSGKNWPSDIYDNRGVLAQLNNAHAFYDSGSSEYWFFGGNMNGGLMVTTGGAVYYRGHNFYTTPDLLNYTFQGQLTTYPASWGTTVGGILLERLHCLRNPNPLNSANTIVFWGGANGAGFNYAACFVAQAMGVPTPKGFAQPNGANVVDCNLFGDDVDDGTGHGRNKAYFVGDNDSSFIYATQLDPATDWTSFTGGNTTIGTAGAHSWNGTIEAPVVFKYPVGGNYFLLASQNVPYGSGNADMRYASATTLSGLNSATASSSWANAPLSAQVAFNTQMSCVLAVHGSVSPAFVFIGDQQDAGDTASPINMYNAKTVMLPASTVTGGSQVNAFPSTGVLSLQAPPGWDLSWLPAELPPPSLGTANGSCVVAGQAVSNGEADGTSSVKAFAVNAGVANGTSSAFGQSLSIGTANGTCIVAASEFSNGTANGTCSVQSSTFSVGTISTQATVQGQSVSVGNANGTCNVQSSTGNNATANGTSSVSGQSLSAGTTNGQTSAQAFSQSIAEADGISSVLGRSISVGAANGISNVVGSPPGVSNGIANGFATAMAQAVSVGVSSGTCTVLGSPLGSPVQGPFFFEAAAYYIGGAEAAEVTI